MTFMTFDLWPHDFKCCIDHCDSHMHTCPRFKVDMLNRSWIVKREMHFHVFYDLCDLDLWPHASQICGKHFAAHVHTWPSLQLDMSNRSWIIKGKVCFYVFYDLCDLWPWPSVSKNLCESLCCPCAYMTKVSSWYVKPFLNYQRKSVFLCILWPLWPLTFDLMVPKFVWIIVLPMCINDQGFKLICQTVLELSKEKCIFMYSMTSVTFDLEPQHSKI